MNSFATTNAFGVIYIGWMYPYHKVWLYDGMGGRSKNPDFNNTSGYLLDLKDTTNRNFNHAVSGFSNAFLKELKNPHLLGKEEDVIVCVVPSSKAGKVAPGLEKIAKNLERDDRRIREGVQTLVRHTAIEKLANGGNRDILVHRQSIRIGEKVRSDKTYIVLDDITTTGNSLAACAEILRHNGARRVLPIALGKTYDR